MVQPDLEDLLASSYWVCDKCEAPFATKELAEKHELKCGIKEDVENLEKILEKTEKITDVEADSSMGKLEKLIERRNAGEITSEEFEEMKKEILERKPQVSKDPVEIVQEEVHDDRGTIVKDSVISKSSIGSGSSKMHELEKLKEMFDSGFISKKEMEEMKKEILGK